MAERETGTVKGFHHSKGVGLIERDKRGDIFMPYSNIQGGGFRS
jgi:cold shock CspA family protein